jgi:predicted TIM-barrel fold metal-dependent hydrolase
MTELAFAPDCPPPLDEIRAPALRLPVGSTDCHFHAFGPYDRFPLAPDRSYTPPESTLDGYRRVMQTLGLQRCVVVQPSVYGTDNRCTLDALASLGPTVARGVAVIADDLDAQGLAALHAAGVRGVRYNSVTGARDTAGGLMALAERIAPLGWHLQMYAGAAEWQSLAPMLSRLPVEVVIDHLGEVDPAQGPQGAAFVSLMRFLETGRGWVKLVGYRCSHRRAPYADLAPYVQALVQAHGDRLLWGTDWPHPIRFDDMPDDGALVDAFGAWVDDPVARRRILVDNPARLYGFTDGP